MAELGEIIQVITFSLDQELTTDLNGSLLELEGDTVTFQGDDVTFGGDTVVW